MIKMDAIARLIALLCFQRMEKAIMVICKIYTGFAVWNVSFQAIA